MATVVLRNPLRQNPSVLLVNNHCETPRALASEAQEKNEDDLLDRCSNLSKDGPLDVNLSDKQSQE